MTISSDDRVAGPYAGNDATTVFPFAFKVFSANDLLVVKFDVASSIETPLVINTDFTATLNADQNVSPGGIITLPLALATGKTLTLTTDIAELQPTDLTNQGGFFPQVITTALDRLTILIQQLRSAISRSLTLPLSAPSGVSTELPFPAANQAIGWDDAGLGLKNYDLASLFSGTYIGAGAGAILRYVQDRLREKISAKDYGARGDGVTNDSIALQRAFNAAANGELYLPAGIYIAEGLVLPSNIRISGAGKVSCTIRRPASSISTAAVISASGGSGIYMSDLNIDGNKAAQTVAANNIYFSACSNIRLERVISQSAKAGIGIYVLDGTDGTNGSTSVIENCIVASCDGQGLYIRRSWNIHVRGCLFGGNSEGIDVINLVFPPVADVSDNLIIENNVVRYNTDCGIRIASAYTGGSPSAPIFGHDVPGSARVIVKGNTAEFNGSYGIVGQGKHLSITNNICKENCQSVSYAGGILFNAAESICDSNILINNPSYGIDAGGARDSSISGNVIDGASNAAMTFLNLGAAIGCIASKNIIRTSGSGAHVAIACSGVDGGDATHPFGQTASDVQITNNSIRFLGSNPALLGIWVLRLAASVTIRGNQIIGIPDANRAVVNECDTTVIENNSVNGTRIYYVTTAAAQVIPDWANDVIAAPGVTVTSIKRYSQSVFDGRVRDVSITNGGTGYTYGSNVAASFSGGGGAGAAGYAVVEAGGRVVGIVITNTGSGYTSAPSVTINGSGAGATGTALIGCANNTMSQLKITFIGVVNLTDGSNLALNGDYTSSAGGGSMVLNGVFGNWHELGRCVV